MMKNLFYRFGLIDQDLQDFEDFFLGGAPASFRQLEKFKR
jgi:hypothetical protein